MNRTDPTATTHTHCPYSTPDDDLEEAYSFGVVPISMSREHYIKEFQASPGLVRNGDQRVGHFLRSGDGEPLIFWEDNGLFLGRMVSDALLRLDILC